MLGTVTNTGKSEEGGSCLFSILYHCLIDPMRRLIGENGIICVWIIEVTPLRLMAPISQFPVLGCVAVTKVAVSGSFVKSDP